MKAIDTLKEPIWEKKRYHIRSPSGLESHELLWPYQVEHLLRLGYRVAEVEEKATQKERYHLRSPSGFEAYDFLWPQQVDQLRKFGYRVAKAE